MQKTDPETTQRPTYRKNGEGYEILDGDRPIGYVMKFYPMSRIRRGRVSVVARWSAVDMDEHGQEFASRADAARWLWDRSVADA